MVKVFVVDDMSDVRSAVKIGLTNLNKGYEVFEAKSGDEAVEQLKNVQPDVILMDVMMPGMDGLDTTMMIKNDPNYKHIPIIILTAKTDKLTKGMSEVAADAFLEKPFTIETLDDAIQKALQQR